MCWKTVIFYKVKSTPNLCCSNATSIYLPKTSKNICPREDPTWILLSATSGGKKWPSTGKWIQQIVIYPLSGIWLSSERTRTTDTWNHTDESSQTLCWTKEVRHRRAHTVTIPFTPVLEQATPICGDKNQDCGRLTSGEIEKGAQGNSLGYKTVLYLESVMGFTSVCVCEKSFNCTKCMHFYRM